MVKFLARVDQDLRLRRHAQYHHVDWTTAGRWTRQKAIHLHLDSGKEDGHIDGVLERHCPEVDFAHRPEKLGVPQHLLDTFSVNPTLFNYL